jgi:hypothetical protein
MSEKKPDDESLGIFLGDRSPIAVPLKPLHVGPGEPGPADEWKVPTEPAGAEDDVSLDQVHSSGGAVLPLPPASKG